MTFAGGSGRRFRAGPSSPESTLTGESTPETPGESESDSPGSPAGERRALIDLVIYAYDRTMSAGIRARLAEGLEAVGVAVLNPDGEAFDPGRHEAGGTEATVDPARHGLVAETELAGFIDRGVVIRDPVVVVYRLP